MKSIPPKLYVGLLIVGSSTCAAAPTFAQTTLISNLSQTTTDTTTFVFSNDRYAQAFTTDGTTHTLFDAALSLKLNDTSVSTTDALNLALYSDGQGIVGGFLVNDSQPTTQIASIANATVTSGTSNTYFFAPAAQVVLSPNTTYWLVATDLNNNNIGWDLSSSASTTGAGSLPTNSIGSSGDAGSTWSIAPTTAGPQKFQVRYVTAAVVPEASTLSLLLLGVFSARKRRR